MKKLLSIAAMLLTILPMQAQTAEGALDQAQEIKVRAIDSRPRTEVSVSYGLITLPDVAVTLGGVLATALTFGLGKMSDMSISGSFQGEYIYYVTPHVGIGATAGYEHITLTMDSYNGKDENGTAQYSPGKKNRLDFIHVMPEVKASWFYTKNVSMYTKVAAGVGFSAQTQHSEDSDDSSLSFACQVAPIGIDFGGAKMRAFIEAGFGFQGLFTGGLRFAF